VGVGLSAPAAPHHSCLAVAASGVDLERLTVAAVPPPSSSSPRPATELRAPPPDPTRHGTPSRGQAPAASSPALRLPPATPFLSSGAATPRCSALPDRAPVIPFWWARRLGGDAKGRREDTYLRRASPSTQNASCVCILGWRLVFQRKTLYTTQNGYGSRDGYPIGVSLRAPAVGRVSAFCSMST
jgi:hypothetical protein